VKEPFSNPAGNEDTGVSAPWQTLLRAPRFRPLGWTCWIALASLAFIQPLVRLIEEALQSQLNSYIPLVPLIVAYLLYAQRGTIVRPYRTSIAGTLILSSIAVAALASEVIWRGSLSINDGLVLTTFAYVSIIAAGGFLFLGARWMSAAAFPIGFLLFMVPLPDAAVNALESLSVLASTEAAAFFFRITGTPSVREGPVFMLPGVVIRVAQECSGIRSSWVLLITSLVASHLLLKSMWRRVVLVVFVIPLGIVRNGFRILVMGLLSIYVGPRMLDSPIHHQGGPLFFLLSLVPLYTLLWWLRRRER